MIKEIIATGKDVIEAKENARAALGVSELDDVQFQVLHAGSRGIFGIIGVKPAQVKAYIELPDREERRGRRDKKQSRPERAEGDRESAAAPKDESAAAPKEAGESKPAAGKSRRHKKKSGNRAGEIREAIKTASSKPKSEVIPECELNFTLREVSEGEDMSFDFIKTVISDTGLNAEAQLFSCDDGTRRITISGDDASVLIGHHGDTLDALQYLANLASARKNANGERDKSRVTIDIEGYRAKREDTLRALARKMAAKALRNKRSVMLEPMSAYERRIIHSEIQKIEGVSTNSVGSDNNRKIVIFLTDKKPVEIFEEDTREEVNEDAAELEAVAAEPIEADTAEAEEASAPIEAIEEEKTEAATAEEA